MGAAPMPTVWRVLAAWLLLLLVQNEVAAQPLTATAVAAASQPAGQSLYREGRLASGLPVRATVQKGVVLSGADAACASCHRRSGLGGSEGQNSIRPIAGRLLFAPAQTQPARRWDVSPGNAAAHPRYTQATLARALREGVDPAGRVLDALMPRYALSDAEIAQLQAYLATLSATPAPGVTDREIHFATILTPDVHPDKRRAMLDVMQAFFRDKNGGTRQEVRRRAVGSEQMYLAFRTWVLHVWELSGAPHTWRAQLEAHYRQQPVFAVIGGLGDANWQPVHAFCEALELPCLLPDVDYPVLADEDVEASGGYYSLYYSRGVTLEAEVLAKQLAETAPDKAEIVQVFRDDVLGRVPAQALRRALQRRGIEAVTDYPVSGKGPLATGFWAQLLHDGRPTILVVWLDATELTNGGATGALPAGLQTVYLSASLSASQPVRLPDAWLDRVRMVYLFDLPARRVQHLARMTVWLRARNISLTHERTQANAYFALTVAGEAMAHLGENFSRDYFLERIEQMAGTSLSPSIYPHLSLGPGQRFASRGGYIVSFPGGAQGTPMPVSDWLIP